MPTKQVIVLRKDLNMRKGKMCAQASHAAMKELLFKWCALREVIKVTNAIAASGDLKGAADVLAMVDAVVLTPAETEWYLGSFRKITVSVNSEAELVALHEAALAKGLASHMIEDHGLTEFHGVLTKTCIAIGPCFDEDVDPLTGHLPLL